MSGQSRGQSGGARWGNSSRLVDLHDRLHGRATNRTGFELARTAPTARLVTAGEEHVIVRMLQTDFAEMVVGGGVGGRGSGCSAPGAGVGFKSREIVGVGEVVATAAAARRRCTACSRRLFLLDRRALLPFLPPFFTTNEIAHTHRYGRADSENKGAQPPCTAAAATTAAVTTGLASTGGHLRRRERARRNSRATGIRRGEGWKAEWRGDGGKIVRRRSIDRPRVSQRAGVCASCTGV